MTRLIACSLAMVLLSTASFAASLDFRYAGATGWATEARFAGLTVLAGTESGGQVQKGQADIAALAYRGLGVRSAEDTGLYDPSAQIDTYGANDVVIFQFDRAVQLERISFSGTEWWDRFDLYAGAQLSLKRTMKVDDLAGYDWYSSIGLGAGLVGTTFAIGASQYTSCGYSIAEGRSCWSEDSAFHITGITFSEIEPIPLPSAALLLLSALVGGGALLRRAEAGKT